MKIIRIIAALAIGSLAACEQLEEISTREYAFVESIGITDLDETGATVNFEVKQNGINPIDTYGVEFWRFTFAGDNSVRRQKIFKTGTPESPMVDFRIAYDLLVDDYVVRPFVSSDGVTVYGENLILKSLGVSPPKISSVTPKDIKFIDQIHIQGDFFNSLLNNNEVIILGLEDKFNLVIDSVDNQNIWMRVNLKDISFKPSGERYDIQVRSGGKSSVVKDAIGVLPPQILSVAPKGIFVGDSLDVELNFFFNRNDFSFALTDDSGGEMPLFKFRELEAGRYRVLIERTPAGRYDFAVKTASWQVVFPEKVEILPSWTLFQSGIQAPDAMGYRVVTSPERLIWVGSTSTTAGRMFSLNPESSVTQELPALPGFRGLRSRSASVAAQGRYLYYGLGINSSGGSAEHLKDFYRFDFQTGQWERLADLPFEFSRVNKGLEINGKIYLVLDDFRNFREYDPQTNTWTLTPVEVPSILRNTEQFVQAGEDIYSLFTAFPLQITVVRYGQDERWLPQIYGEPMGAIDGMSFWDGNLIFTKAGIPAWRMDPKTSILRPVQGIGSERSGTFPVWPSRVGLLLPFPNQAQAGGKESSIYRLIQDFD